MMPTHYSSHAIQRSQQRGIPPFVDELLNRFGEEIHDGHGCIRITLTKKSFKQIARKFGRTVSAKFKEYSGVFKIEGSDGVVVTTGYQTKRIRNR